MTRQTSYNPFRITFFAHPNTLNPMFSYSCKKVGGGGVQGEPGGTDIQSVSPSTPSLIPTAKRRPSTRSREGPLSRGHGKRVAAHCCSSTLSGLCARRLPRPCRGVKIHMQHSHPPGREAKDAPHERFYSPLPTVDRRSRSGRDCRPPTTASWPEPKCAKALVLFSLRTNHHLLSTPNISFASRRDGDTLPNWKLGGKQ
jgi:hypothetical protein